jgi:hypothetical protein
MKKIIFFLAFVIIVHCIRLGGMIEDCMSQWQPDVRLTNNFAFSNTSYNNAWCIASSGTVVHAVWYDYRDSNWEIYYKRSIDAGLSWGADTRLTINTASSLSPSVAVSGPSVHVVLQDNRDGNEEIYYKRSSDGGVSWGADTRLTNNSALSKYPSVAVFGSLVNVVWQDNRDGYNPEIYCKRSTDAGVSWGADTRLTNDTSGSYFPSLAVSGPVVHVVWMDGRDGNWEIYYKRSTNAGISWGADTRLTNITGTSTYPSIAVYGTVVHVVWSDYRDGNYEIYYKRNPTGNPIGIKNISSVIPSSYSLQQNYPNPFNPTTKIKFDIPSSGFPIKTFGNDNVVLKVFDVLGKEIATLVNESALGGQPGTYTVDFDASMLPSGIYFYRLITEGFSETKRMTLIK